jgi:antitoxin component YwqK of YwqJK toxin-antitoxin module
MSIEKQIIKDCIEGIHFMDVENMSNLIETYIYQSVSYTDIVNHTGDITYLTYQMRFDKKHGLSQIYYQPSELNGGKKFLSIEREYKNGKLDGPFKVYFPNGELSDIYYYKDGNMIDKINFKLFNYY